MDEGCGRRAALYPFYALLGGGLEKGIPTCKGFIGLFQGRLDNYLSIVGFIGDSSSIRNIFEMLEPMWLLTCSILNVGSNPRSTQTHLIISSEWSNISPSIYSRLPNLLKDFVLIGLPASESSNPLLLPLAGHELGHLVWQNNGYDKDKIIYDTIIQKLKKKNSSPTLLQEVLNNKDDVQLFQLAIRHLEESFCDFLGLRLFGASFIHSFYYLAFSLYEQYRLCGHPPTASRFGELNIASKKYGIQFPDYISNTQHVCADDKCSLLCEIRRELLPRLFELVEAATANKTLPDMSNGSEVKRIAKNLAQLAPAQNVQFIADIFNAGWLVYLELIINEPATQSSFLEGDDLHDKRLDLSGLINVMAKNLEIFTYEYRTRS